jgi:hypothetical protein
MRHFITLLAFILLTGLTSRCYSQLDVAMLLGKRAKEIDPPVAFGGYLKFGVPISEADEISAEASLLTWDEKDAGYFAGKVGYVYTLNRQGYGLFLEPQVGYVFAGSDPWYNDYYGNGDFTGPVGTMNVGYRFGQNSFKADLALRYETVFSNNVGKISTIGLRFAISLGIGRGKYNDQ